MLRSAETQQEDTDVNQRSNGLSALRVSADGQQWQQPGPPAMALSGMRPLVPGHDGTAAAHLTTPVEEVTRTLLVVMHRGGLRAAEEITGHKYETIGQWLRRAGRHAEAVTAALLHDLHLSEGEVDEFWPFVGKRGPAPGPVTGEVAEGGERWGCFSIDRPSRFIVA